MATIKDNPPSEATADSDSLGDEGEAHAGQVAAGKTGTSTGKAAGKASVTLRPRNETSVLIICGGLSHERDISISSGHRVGGFLEDAGWQVRYHDMDSELLQYLSDPATRPDIVWPLLHGANGEDGSIRDILEMEGLPYIGSRAKASRTAWSKPIAKNVVRKLAGLSTSHSVTLPESMFRELGVGKVIDLLVDSLGLPLFIKPTMGGSALGCTLVTDAKQLPQAMVSCFAYGEVALVERAISGTEVSVSVLDIDGEPLVLPPLEIVTPNGTYDYDARYTPGPTDFYVPARLPAAVLKATQDAALAAHRTLSLRDLSRTDFIVDADGIPQFLESNVTPGMTDTSLLPQAAVAAGYDLADLYSQLVESVLRQDRAQPHR
ncbi:D-alanine--D-alanine ligase family protein [Bifidobacterium tibiigranuli]|jgi:D-alanine-D-alanine ligase|uniref:D-alanine--D-alanine ligase family protein n=1 Tax=Bifidobacterium tibiigranuli TaxID=2172043 RepID=UPI0026F2C36F|nr:D-alanine--D-alanine ligase [Bifidobacterium tibiigranuli]MCI1649082.1 D-alanine--D-alanine ligase [Bifidobacterium tibiigranuli]MCI1673251.1 D-alanine--D-alanine ligase [Bifidobacterium tibiigranuli]MCI1713504.1 D-alanine--D-alanine ligase [Bifidobacterium tibiigranuli]MCI1834204.1 D-alanine--D-alanine ligase [Bifidobacterium tibiigranuli]MCI2186317.1 D-alanine--D-alanine ligase [Bifidobacterium tibiigranuli]